MPDNADNGPDWQHCDDWDEFQWEAALKHSDHLAGRYFRMLERFGDLPDAEDLIAQQLGDNSLSELDEADVYTTSPLDAWRDEDDDDEFDEDEPLAMDDDDAGLYYESCAVFQLARRLARGWCNIEASVIRPEDRQWGMKVLFYFGRLLSYIALSLGDGSFDRVPASIAFAKRAAQQVNLILGEIDGDHPRHRRYRATMRHIRAPLLELLDMLVSYLGELRERQAGTSPSQ